ncbi:MAG: hypothetical protein Q7S42_05695, partial [Candidatus Omnitrophota bacterium]|nr:hypothetical protein [Candidatus Omnitrophota bacterium]
MKIKKILSVLLCSFLLLDLVGCESFVRKFTRKSKKSDQPVEMVLTPEEYKGPNMTKDELYRQYFLYWKSWQDELINALTQKASLKKKVDCAQEALKNLTKMKMLLVEDAQKNLEVYIAKTNDFLSDMETDAYGTLDDRNYQTARLIKSNIEQKFVY